MLSPIEICRPKLAPPSPECIATMCSRAATRSTFEPLMRNSGGCTPEVAPGVASRICTAGHRLEPFGMRHSATASPVGVLWYQATTPVPAPSISTVGVSPVPGSARGRAVAVAGATASSAAAIRTMRRTRRIVAVGSDPARRTRAGAVPAHGAQDQQHDHGADNGPDDAAEVELVLVADPEDEREERPPDERADDADDDRLDEAHGVVAGQKSPSEIPGDD